MDRRSFSVETKQRRMVRQMNDELESIWEEAVWINRRAIPVFAWRKWREPWKTSVSPSRDSNPEPPGHKSKSITPKPTCSAVRY
jgi:hypothetical protein